VLSSLDFAKLLAITLKCDLKRTGFVVLWKPHIFGIQFLNKLSFGIFCRLKKHGIDGFPFKSTSHWMVFQKEAICLDFTFRLFNFDNVVQTVCNSNLLAFLFAYFFLVSKIMKNFRLTFSLAFS